MPLPLPTPHPRPRRRAGCRRAVRFAAVVCLSLGATGCARVAAEAGAEPAEPPPHLLLVERYVDAFNTGDAERLAPVLEGLYSAALLEDFGGARAAAWDRIELFRTYGPVRVVHVDQEPAVPIVWTRGTLTGGWIGHQFHLDDGGAGRARVARHTTWRAWPVPYPERPLTETQVADSMRQYLTRLSEAGLFSGSIALSHGGRTVLAGSWGRDGQSDARPVTAGTRFHIASVTKLLTVTAFLRLVEQGEVALDDPLSRWIPEYPRPWRDRVTARHLLTHTSGIELDEDPEFLAQVRRARSADDLLRAQIEHIAGGEPRFEPGSEYDYTSEGIDLLAVIMERATGRSWTEVVRERVLGPAGMAHTRFAVPTDEGDWALGFTSLEPDLSTTTPGSLRPATAVLTPVAKPSSGVWSTADDLHRFTRALLDHRLLGPAWTDSLLTPARVHAELPKYGIRSWVGLGAQGEDLWGVRTVGHGGVVPGYSAAIEYLPENDWLMTVVSNTGEATGYLVFQRFLELAGHSPGPPAADDAGRGRRGASLPDRLDAYFEPLAATGDFSGAVLVARGSPSSATSSSPTGPAGRTTSPPS